MRITFVGHAGLFVETAAGTVLCDPWTSPAFFASWFPFPDNRGLDWDRLGQADYLYVSHLHRDHYDPDTLRRYVNKRATVLVPDYPTDELRDTLADLGFTRFVQTVSGEPVELDGLQVMIDALVSPADGPIGDSALALYDGTTRIFNQNDARPRELDVVTRLGGYDGHFLQYSGAIWYPLVYRLPQPAKAAFGRDKRRNGMTRALRYVEGVDARFVFPSAGPPCFLDPDLRFANDVDRDETNPFPDQPVFLEEMARADRDGGILLIPGSTATLVDGRCEVTHPVPADEVARVFTEKAAYLDAYARRAEPELVAAKREWAAAPVVDPLPALKEWFEPLLAEADRICAGVGGPVLLHIGDRDVVVDFPARTVREWGGERCRFQFWIDPVYLNVLVAEHEIDWVNSLFLGMRFEAARIGPYNEYVYTFFKCLSEERINYAEGWYAEQENVVEYADVDGWRVQRRCPHLKADLTKFGHVDDGVLTCEMHGWQFELPDGRCLTHEGYALKVAEPAAAESAGYRG